MDDTTSDISPPTILDGRYRIGALLGSGGMGQVFVGEDLRLGRQVAIKVVRPGPDDATLGERLFREARAAARSDHPAVVTAFGYGSDPDLGVDYFVMERLHGETVGQRIQRIGPLPLTLLHRIAIETCDALGAVHDAGVIHRDLKPNNLFLATRGPRVDELRLLDFGVAKQLSLQTITATGQIWGTPVYMAPEQLLDAKRVDPRCDLYALGAVLYECLTGSPPFEADNAVAMAFKVVHESAPDARALRPDAPVELVELISRCMRKDPDERFQHARQLQRALQELAI